MPTKAAWKPTTPPPRCIGRPPSDSGLAELWAYLGDMPKSGSSFPSMSLALPVVGRRMGLCR
jgi:hypothetical protein